MTATVGPLHHTGLRDTSGHPLAVDAHRWFAPPGAAERRALARVVGPALDIGCGPGRHVVALAELGVAALGIDITAPAIRHARSAGATVIERCVFERVPGAGRWRSALLLDGNIGIGGDPVALLRRAHDLLAPDGHALVETTGPGEDAHDRRVRFEISGWSGPWFGWATVDAAGLHGFAGRSGFTVAEQWCDDDRWFAWLAA
jgi:SAM-dependent methyltransferase